MKYASMKNNKDSNRITRNIRSTYRPLWNVSFAYTHQILLINFMNLKGEKQTDSPLWSSLNLYNIFYDHLDTENIPFPYTGLCDVCEYECEGYIWIWSACQQCVPFKMRKITKFKTTLVIGKFILRKKNTLYIIVIISLMNYLMNWTILCITIFKTEEEVVFFDDDEITKCVWNKHKLNILKAKIWVITGTFLLNSNLIFDTSAIYRTQQDIDVNITSIEFRFPLSLENYFIL